MVDSRSTFVHQPDPVFALALPQIGLTGAHCRDKRQGVRAVSADSGAELSFDPRDYPGLRRALSRAVRRACPSWMSESTEDVVQIAMTKVVAVLEGGKSAEEIGLAYIARVAYHAVVDEMRRQRRRRTLTTVDVDEVRGAVAEPRPDPEVATAGTRLGAEIRDCLTQMARSRRLAVVLYLEGRGATEIANMFDWKRKQADNLVYRGIADLRRCLSDKGLEP